jgi:cytochrome c oxidase cbb3-type subunit II
MLKKLLTPFREFFQALFRGQYRLERHSLGLALGILVAGSVGGAVEIAPLFTIDETVEDVPDMRVYTPLEQAGRDLYIREGCYTCHSQMVRTLRDEVDRYGPYSLAVESKYDHPHQWGSKRTGPDLARVGGKYSDDWHVAHLYYPRDVVPESVMPAYRWLMRNRLDVEELPERLATLRMVGVPYTDEMIANAVTDAIGQADPDGERSDGVFERYGEETNVRYFDGQRGFPTEMDAMVAYLQILGQLTDAASAAPMLNAEE